VVLHGNAQGWKSGHTGVLRLGYPGQSATLIVPDPRCARVLNRSPGRPAQSC
jgi:hypothetical protein